MERKSREARLDAVALCQALAADETQCSEHGASSWPTANGKQRSPIQRPPLKARFSVVDEAVLRPTIKKRFQWLQLPLRS
jgi:hypothetical protein